MIIDSFKDSYRFLSNFYPCLVELDGEVYRSIEHAYVAAKSLDPVVRELIRMIDTPGQVKRLGRELVLRPDWDDVKLPIMTDLVTQKFTDVGLRKLLVETSPAELVEGNTWGDTFWGVCDGVGRNHLGRILMSVRERCLL